MDPHRCNQRCIKRGFLLNIGKQSLKPGPGTRASIATDKLIDMP
jgi:hypothetical protein